VDEKGWLSCADCGSMLWFLRASQRALIGKANRRRFRLMACSCARHVRHMIDEQACVRALEVSERHADGLATPGQLKEAYLAAGEALEGKASKSIPKNGRYWAANTARLAADPDLWETRWAVYGAACAGSGVWQWTELSPENQLPICDLIRDVYGNPFQPHERRRFAKHVVGLAQSCYAAFPEVSDDFLILADALEELGEEAAAGDCREKRHAKGCHVIDWLLGKN
jgi:hypothetical protein